MCKVNLLPLAHVLLILLGSDALHSFKGTLKYGAVGEAAVLGNGIYVLDDDGRLKPDTMAFTSGDLMVIVEREKDDDGDEIAITYLDMTAAYITVK